MTIEAPGGASVATCPACRSEVDLAKKARRSPAAAPEAAELLPGLRVGDRLGSCVIEGTIGRGGMGTVLLATQPSLRRKVALKVLAPGLARDPELVRRFDREARALASSPTRTSSP